jgi:hypothetical protein
VFENLPETGRQGGGTSGIRMPAAFTRHNLGLEAADDAEDGWEDWEECILSFGRSSWHGLDFRLYRTWRSVPLILWILLKPVSVMLVVVLVVLAVEEDGVQGL